MKTAMQQLIDDLKNIMDDERYEIGKAAVNDCIIASTSYLETEKHQIINAWENGYNHGACVNEDTNKYHGIQYYTSKIETNKETLNKLVCR